MPLERLDGKKNIYEFHILFVVHWDLEYNLSRRIGKMMRRNSFYKKISSIVLIALMVITVLTIGVSEETQAATGKSFSGKGKSTVTISDAEGYDLENQKPITQYIKYKAGVTGYITLKFTSDSQLVSAKTGLPISSEGDITLCNSNKKAIGVVEAWYCENKYTGDNTRTYGVTKGQTYYFKVEAWGGVQISASVVKVAKSTANSRTKAVNLVKGKTAKGIMIAGEKKADWYKIKLSKGAKLKLNYTVKTMGYANAVQYGYKEAGIRFTFVMDTGNGQWTSKTDLTPLKPENAITVSIKDQSSGIMYDIEPGTYYVKVEPINKKSSGYYTIKWSTF